MYYLRAGNIFEHWATTSYMPTSLAKSQRILSSDTAPKAWAIHAAKLGVCSIDGGYRLLEIAVMNCTVTRANDWRARGIPFECHHGRLDGKSTI